MKQHDLPVCLTGVVKTSLFLISLWGLGWAQEQPVEFTHLNNYSHFPTNRITTIHQGQYGFLWFGTNVGLYRYDGSNARWYYHDPDDNQTISSGKVRAIHEDPHGGLWIGSQGGLSLLDRRSGRFQHFLHDPNNPETLNSNNIWSIQADRQGRLWVGTDRGLNRLENGRVQRLIGAAFSKGVPCLEIDDDDQLWLGTEGFGAGKLGAQGQFIPLTITENLKVSTLHFQKEARSLWVGTVASGLFQFRRDGTWQRYKHNPQDANSLPATVIKDLDSDDTGSLWIATENGLYQRKPEENTFRIYREDPGDPASLSATIINSILVQDDLLWVATGIGGADLLDLRRNQFGFYDFLNQGGALSMAFDGPDEMWVGCRRGLAHMNLKDARRQWLIPSHTVRSLRIIPSGDLIIATDSALFLLPQGDVENPLETLMEGPRFWQTTIDGQTLWVGSSEGLYHYDLNLRKIIHHYPGLETSTDDIGHKNVSTLVSDAQGEIWIGTYGGGVKRIAKDGTVHHMMREEGNPSSLSANDVTQIFIDNQQNVWVATFSGGLNRYDAEHARFEKFGESMGLPTTVVAVAQDSANYLWVMAYEALIRLDTKTLNFRRFTSLDGVILGGAVPGSAALSPDNQTIFFGGSHGLINFDATQIQFSEAAPIVVTGLRKGNRETAHMLDLQEGIQLTPDDKTLSIDVALLDYRNPQTCKLGYQRIGLDDDIIWETGTSTSINYTRYLSYGGKGTLELEGHDHHGQPRQLTLEILVASPTWVKWLPLWTVLGFALLVSLIYGVTYLVERRKRKALMIQATMAEQRRELAEQRAHVAEQQKEVEQRERQLQEEHTAILQEHLEQVSTEIAGDLHDGPLASLNGLSFHLRTLVSRGDMEGVVNALEQVSDEMLPQICGTLRNVCGQLLLPDFRYGLAAELETFADVIQGMYPSLTIERDLQDLDYSLSKEEQACLYRIFRTLLKNIGQHSEASEASLSLKEEDDCILLILSDNGKGFVVPDDWEVFRANKHYGMYMANYFAESMGGTLTVTSRPGAGTRSEVRVTAQIAIQEMVG